MPVLAALGICFQVLFAVHAYKTGRDRYWIYILIFFPGIGCLIYFFCEYLPDLQHSRRLKNFSTEIGHSLNPGKRLRRIEELIELTPSVNNKKMLAEAYVNYGRFDEAIAIYMSCREGAHANDPQLLQGLSCAYFFKGDFLNAKKQLDQYLEIGSDTQAIMNPFKLLYARTVEALNDAPEADRHYAEVVKTFSGEEARVRYALFLKKIGRDRQAEELFDQVLKNARLSPRYYRKNQKAWIDIARQAKENTSRK